MLASTFRLGCISVFTVFAFSCAVQQHSRLLTTTANRPAVALASAIETQAVACWQDEPGFFNNGVRVKAQRSIQGTYVITASNWVAGGGAQPAFLVIEVTEASSSTSQILVSGLDFPDNKEFISDVKRWVHGELGCG